MTAMPKVFDGDGHVFEDPEGMTPFMPKIYRDWKESHGVFKKASWFTPFGHLHSPTGTHPEGAFGAGKFVGVPEWSTFLDEAGIEAAALYPTMGLTSGFIANIDYAIAVCRAYNDWLHATYLKNDPRFRGMGLIPMQEPAIAVEELRRCVEDLGMCGAMLPGNGLKSHLGAKEYWPIYQEADRLGCALAVHGGNHVGLGMNDMNVFAVAHAIGHPLGMMIALGGLVFNGVFQRFPHFRIAFLEGGTAWLLFCLERFTSSAEANVPLEHRGELLKLPKGQRPSDYILELIDRTRVFIGCEGDEYMLGDAIRKVGNRPFLFSSDFPHETGVDRCKHHIAAVQASEVLTADDKAALLHKNAERFYRRAS